MSSEGLSRGDVHAGFESAEATAESHLHKATNLDKLEQKERCGQLPAAAEQGRVHSWPARRGLRDVLVRAR